MYPTMSSMYPDILLKTSVEVLWKTTITKRNAWNKYRSPPDSLFTGVPSIPNTGGGPVSTLSYIDHPFKLESPLTGHTICSWGWSGMRGFTVYVLLWQFPSSIQWNIIFIGRLFSKI